MKKEIMQDWVKALRSGEYKQGQEALKIGDSYCCLGVLCDLYRKNVEGAPEWDSLDDYMNMLAALPAAVQEWAGMKTNDGMYPTDEGSSRFLVTDNDGDPDHSQEPKSFAEIADIIEAHGEEL
jgi:hypothetical protein